MIQVGKDYTISDHRLEDALPQFYEPSDLPNRTRLGVNSEMVPYLEGLREGKGVGDGEVYQDSASARRVGYKYYLRAKKLLTGASDPAISLRVWDDDAGAYRWAIVPK